MSRPRLTGVWWSLLPLLVLAPALGVTATATAEPPRPDLGEAWFGPTLDASADSEVDYADRLGASPSLVAVALPYPLDEPSADVLDRFARQAAAAGTVLVLDLRPSAPLADLAPEAADVLAATVRGLERRDGADFLVRFAPEMNGSWEIWGQQPGDYVATFREVAARIHDRTDAGMVWSPVYGSGYPFRGSDGALDAVLERDRSTLDTDGNGLLDARDDPYRPYFPGDAAVDWVGLSLYRLGQAQSLTTNDVLPAAEFEDRLAERWGYGDDAVRRPFVDRFARADRPMLVETAAPYNPAVGGDGELAVKRSWWRQVLTGLDDEPRIGAVTWLEVLREEPEVADVPVDWRVTAEPRIARALLRDLRASRVALAPVVGPDADSDRERRGGVAAPTPPGSDPVLETEDAATWWWWVVAAGLLVAALLAGRLVPRWRYPGDDERDERLDLLRGVLLLGAAVGLTVSAGLGWIALSTWLVVGAVGGLLVISGIAHADSPRPWRRALTVYVVAVVLTLLHLLLDAAPGVRSPFGTYPDARDLLGYPPPGPAVVDVMTLQASPAPIALLGLFALLAAVVPVLHRALDRGWWWLALSASWALYVVGTLTDASIDALAWEADWPVLVWQLPFVHGLVLAHHRDVVGRLAPAGIGLLSVVSAGWGALQMADLGPQRQPALLIVLVVAVTLLASATSFWSPLRVALGWMLPLGRRPLVLSCLLVGAVLLASLV